MGTGKIGEFAAVNCGGRACGREAVRWQSIAVPEPEGGHSGEYTPIEEQIDFIHNLLHNQVYTDY